MTPSTTDAVIGPAQEDDLGLVYGTWLDSFYDAHGAGPLPRDVYRSAYTETIGRILEQPDTLVLVARSPRDAGTLYGFACVQGRTLHYVCVKAPYRKMGIADALLTAAGLSRLTRFTYTFKTSVARALEQKWKGARFDPMPMRRLKRIAPAT